MILVHYLKIMIFGALCSLSLTSQTLAVGHSYGESKRETKTEVSQATSAQPAQRIAPRRRALHAAQPAAQPVIQPRHRGGCWDALARIRRAISSRLGVASRGEGKGEAKQAAPIQHALGLVEGEQEHDNNINEDEEYDGPGYENQMYHHAAQPARGCQAALIRFSQNISSMPTPPWRD